MCKFNIFLFFSSLCDTNTVQGEWLIIYLFLNFIVNVMFRDILCSVERATMEPMTIFRSVLGWPGFCVYCKYRFLLGLLVIVSTEKTVIQSPRKNWWWSFMIWFAGRRNRWVSLFLSRPGSSNASYTCLTLVQDYFEHISSPCPASRWHLLTTLFGCSNALFSLAAMSRGKSSLRSSKVSRQH